MRDDENHDRDPLIAHLRSGAAAPELALGALHGARARMRELDLVLRALPDPRTAPSPAWAETEHEREAVRWYLEDQRAELLRERAYHAEVMRLAARMRAPRAARTTSRSRAGARARAPRKRYSAGTSCTRTLDTGPPDEPPARREDREVRHA